MSDSQAIHDKFTVERRYPKPVATLFAAFADQAVKRRWLGAGHDHEVDSFDSDFRVGGPERVCYRMGANTPFPGTPLVADGRHEDIVDGKRIVMSSTMSIGDHRISTALVTFEFSEDGDGSALLCTHQAVFYEGADGPDMRRHGWETLLDRLGQALQA